MKKIMLLAAFAAATVCASAQLTFGINAGYDHVSLNYKSNDQKENHNMDGFHVGPTIHYGFNQVKGLGLGGAVYYQFAGKEDKDYKKSMEMLGIKNAHAIGQLHGVQVPVRVDYDYDFNSDWGIFGFAGPQLNFGIFNGNIASGKLGDKKYHYSANAYTGNVVTKVGDNKETVEGEGSYRMFDVMLGFGIGAHYQNYYLTIGYDLGLINRIANETVRKNGYKIHQDQLQVSVGYNF